MFDDQVAQALKHYVYRLIDPRNGETFYVSKGQGNRVFMHATGDISPEYDVLLPKMSRIREIMLAGFQVLHVVHRHGLDGPAAILVKAALIDAYPGLTNAVSGQGSDDFGVMHADEIIGKYKAPVAEFEHRVLLININNTSEDRSVYDAVRYAWRLSLPRAQRAQYVLAVVRGLIVEVFVADEWLPASPHNFPGLEPFEGRFGFIGHLAPDEVRVRYRYHRVPVWMQKKGAANPVRYSDPAKK
jgi:hypothetical protein